VANELIAPSILSAEIARAGADTFVAGSAIFGTANYIATLCAMRAELATATDYSSA